MKGLVKPILIVLFVFYIALSLLSFGKENYVAVISDLHHPYFKNTINSVIEKLVQLKPLYVFMLGDLTEMGKEEEFDDLSKILSVFSNNGINYNILLGNHDTRWSDKVRKTKNIDNALYENFRVDIGEISFIGIDTSMYFQHLGHIGEKQLEWIKTQLEDCKKQGKLAILLSHHPFGGPINYTDDGWKLMDIIKNYNVPIILYGHTHKYDYFGMYNGAYIQTVGATREGWITLISWDKDNLYLSKTNPKQGGKEEIVKIIPKKKEFREKSKNVQTKELKSVNSKYFEEIVSIRFENSIFSQALANDGVFYAIDYSGNIKAINSNGQFLWKNAIQNPVVANIEYYDGIIFIGDLYGNLYLINSKNGRVQRILNFDGPIFSIKVGKVSIVIGVGKTIHILDLKEFKRLATYNLNGVIQREARYYQGKFFQTSWGNELFIIDEDGKLFAKIPTGSGYYTPGGIVPLVLENLLIVTTPSGVVQAYDWKNKTILWTTSGLKTGYSDIVKSDPNFVTTSIDGLVYSLDINSGKVIWKTSVGSPIYNISPLILSDGKIIVGTNNGEIVLISKDGKILEKVFVHNSYLINKILYSNGKILLSFTDGLVKILKIKE
ncbi:PQQ-binding-like beta-propeller repeat protein [Fervidobacterium sp. 2310opik-2]|uniref:metallophosphoesterase n=1 Tax=Fervidobacterium sp. 2310opik-2 TaxID=1755815 RepID=UPI0013E04DF4|nr:PQQ-binding-like beta-propeller repeat protein [Fervidobacterium sp. 2310opik-2]KAF2961149.1 hypothetical protein AS161_02980 [Fervidobacterium sp. 2310opik-2]